MNAGEVSMDCMANDRDNMFTLMYVLFDGNTLYCTIEASDK